ncbi:hypothetical protein T190_25750 [Sinorhizobium meliloti CCBAU 01290]|nr:hypothetical protein T190_25750 [Sinorhizobium meliloti CCBAU 01290]
MGVSPIVSVIEEKTRPRPGLRLQAYGSPFVLEVVAATIELCGLPSRAGTPWIDGAEGKNRCEAARREIFFQVARVAM